MTTQAQVLDLMVGLQDRVKTAVIIITHDLGIIAEMVDDVLLPATLRRSLR